MKLSKHVNGTFFMNYTYYWIQILFLKKKKVFFLRFTLYNCQLFLWPTHSEQLMVYKFENRKMHTFIRETLINKHNNYVKMLILVKITKSLDWLKYLNTFSLVFFIKQFWNVHYFHLKTYFLLSSFKKLKIPFGLLFVILIKFSKKLKIKFSFSWMRYWTADKCLLS